MDHHTLFIHIGTPKTGTSALQSFLCENRDLLLNSGYAYPLLANDVPTQYEETNTFKVINGLGLWESYRDIEKKGAEEVFLRMLQCIKRYLQNYHVILSCEHLWVSNRWGKFTSFFEKISDTYRDIKIIVYLRRQDQFLESVYGQNVKWAIHETLTLERWIDQAIVSGVACYLDKLMTLKNIFHNNLIVRLFEKSSFRGGNKDIVSDFLTTIGISLEEKQMKQVGYVNQSFDASILEIKRILNQCLRERNRGLLRKYDVLFEHINKQAAQIYEDFSNKIMPYQMREKILQQYESENQEIAKIFFGKTDGMLFNDMNISIPCKYHQATTFEQAMIHVFAILLAQSKNM